jgi:outer membrane protein TolC
LALGAGEAAVEAAQKELEWARLRLRQDVRAVFAAWSAAERRRELVARHHQRLRRLQERLVLRAERGEESQLVAQRFALAVSQVRSALARAEAELTQARGRALSLHPALPPDAMPLLPGLPPVPDSLSGPPRPDLLARHHELEEATLRRRLAGRVLEFPTLVGGWTRIEDGGEDFDGPYLGLSWDLPLFDRNQGDREEAGRRVAIAEARLRLAENEAAARSEAALDGYAALHAAFAEVADTVAMAPAVVEAASAAFLTGEHGTTDLLETLRSVLESQLAALELHTEALAAHRELELSAGRALTGGQSR